MPNRPEFIDLHMHSVLSDGTDTPEELLQHVRDAGLQMFSVTDHDSIKGGKLFPGMLKAGDPVFISGVEFSCKDEEGQYHILGYCYDPEAEPVNEAVNTGHKNRMLKARMRLDFLRDTFGFDFEDEDIRWLMSQDNPGKPHIANLMVKYEYVETKEIAIREYLNKGYFGSEYLRPEEAIEAILKSGGIPVLAHPSYGSGDQLIIGEEMDHRLKKLMNFGLQGVEGYYSGFTGRLIEEILGFAHRYQLFVTAGSDYHGKNKLINLGDTNLKKASEGVYGLQKFLDKVL